MSREKVIKQLEKRDPQLSNSLETVPTSKDKLSTIKLKIRLPNNKLPNELQKSSEDLELSVELTSDDIDLITDSINIQQISNNVLERLKEYFNEIKLNSLPQISHCEKAKEFPLQKIHQKWLKQWKSKIRKFSKTKSMQFLIEKRPLKRTKLINKSNLSHKILQKQAKSSISNKNNIHKETNSRNSYNLLTNSKSKLKI